MGPGPINADPRVLRAMGAPLLGQFDPQFREYMKQDIGALPRRVPDREPLDAARRRHRARGIEAALVSLIEPGDRVLVPVFGRFGHLIVEIAKRCGAEVHAVETEWGTVFPPKRWRRRSAQFRPEAGRRSRTATRPPPWRSRSPSSASCAASTTRCSTSTPPRRSAAWTCRSTPGSSTWSAPGCRSASAARRAARRSRCNERAEKRHRSAEGTSEAGSATTDDERTATARSSAPTTSTWR